jgi:hypothetical protein
MNKLPRVEIKVPAVVVKEARPRGVPIPKIITKMPRRPLLVPLRMTL